MMTTRSDPVMAGLLPGHTLTAARLLAAGPGGA